jgi:hypothetical protein
MIITGPSVRALAKKRRRCRVDSSAQSMSSMITTSGPFALARSSNIVTASMSRSLIVSSASDGLVRDPVLRRRHSTLCRMLGRSAHALLAADQQPAPPAHSTAQRLPDLPVALGQSGEVALALIGHGLVGVDVDQAHFEPLFFWILSVDRTREKLSCS